MYRYILRDLRAFSGVRCLIKACKKTDGRAEKAQPEDGPRTPEGHECELYSLSQGASMPGGAGPAVKFRSPQPRLKFQPCHGAGAIQLPNAVAQ